MRILISLMCLFTFSLNIKAQFAFNIEFVEPVTEKSIHLKATFNNTTPKPAKVSKQRRVDYVFQGSSVALGNYIVEIQN